tara:strand:+ start:1021 stop:1629 length:609 start_codon:yes stop_codon:yes gene_type:complete
MAAVKWNQDINAGQDWLADINLLLRDGSNRNITKHTLASDVKRHHKSVSVKENVNLKILSAESGNIQLSLSSTQTSNLKFGKWLYDVELTNRKGSYVEITGGGGSGAEAVATVAADGTISAVTVTNGGSGYTEAPTVTISDDRDTSEIGSGATGTGATATATIEGGVVTAVTVTNGGSDYILQIVERVIEGILNIKPEITRS